MLAKLVATAPRGEGWAWELKWDGIRALAHVDGGEIRLSTRLGKDVTHRYPELHGLGDVLRGRDVLLDGEIVALDERGRPSFERLQQRMHVEGDPEIRRRARQTPVVYMIFDLLRLDGLSTLELPYAERRARLAALGLAGPAWQTPAHEMGDGHATLEVSRRYGLEGVVAKRVDSRYEPGRRSGAWVKVKHSLRQEFVVGGWQPGQGARTGSIGSLLVGYYDDGRLHYAGRVGSGLSGAWIGELARLFGQCARDTSPFDVGTPPKGAHFVEPILVVEVRFAEWTSGGFIRQPTFLGARTDKNPRDVRRETPA
jgi:bifunctional non-homologous end joining protein LigD